MIAEFLKKNKKVKYQDLEGIEQNTSNFKEKVSIVYCELMQTHLFMYFCHLSSNNALSANQNKQS